MATEYIPALTDLTHPVQSDDASLVQQEVLLLKTYVNNTVIPALAAGIIPPSASGFSYKGNYSSVVTYVTNNIVTFGGALYIALAATTGNAPTNVVYWSLVVPSNSVLTAEGDMLYYSGGANARLPVGANGTKLVSNGTDPSWVLDDNISGFSSQNKGLRVLNDLTNSVPAYSNLKVSSFSNPCNGPQVRPVARPYSYQFHCWVNKLGEVCIKGSSPYYIGGANAGALAGTSVVANFSAVLGTLAAGETIVQCHAMYNQNILLLTSLGNVWSTGYGAAGVIGDNTTTAKQVFQKIPYIGTQATWSGSTSPIAILHVGYSSAYYNGSPYPAYIGAIFAIDTHGRLFAWGNNTYGQCGLGATTQFNTPQLVSGPWGTTAIVQVHSSGIHTLVLDASGKVYAAGYNAQGQLGDNTLVNKLTFVAVTGAGCTVTATIATILALGDSYQNTYGNSMLLTTTGNFAACGYNPDGRLANNTIVNSQVFVLNTSYTFSALWAGSEGVNCTMYGLLKGTTPTGVLAWGYNVNGQCGTGGVANVLVPSAPVATSANSFSVTAIGGALTQSPIVFNPANITNVFPIAGLGGAATSAVLLYDGTYYWFLGNSTSLSYIPTAAANQIISTPVIFPMPLAFNSSQYQIVDFVSEGQPSAAVMSFYIEGTDGRQWALGSNANKQINDNAAAFSQFVAINH